MFFCGCLVFVNGRNVESSHALRYVHSTAGILAWSLNTQPIEWDESHAARLALHCQWTVLGMLIICHWYVCNGVFGAK